MKTKNIVCFIVFALLLFMTVMGMLFPAGRDPFVPLASSLAMKGKGLSILMAENRRRRLQNEPYVKPFLCSNAAQFASELLKVSQTDEDDLTETDIGIGLWNIAIDDLSECDPSFPLLISANLNLESLKLDISADRRVSIGKKAGAPISLLGDKGIVIVRANGKSQRIRAEYLTRDMILGKDNCHSRSVAFLTPTGRIALKLTSLSKEIDSNE